MASISIKRLFKKGRWIVFMPLIFVNSALADGFPVLTNPLGPTSTFQQVLGDVTTFLLAVAGPICGILVIVGGFQMMMAAGDPEKFSKGKKTLLYAAIGFVVVLFSASVAPLISNILSGQ